jgi:hypothetical protein
MHVSARSNGSHFPCSSFSLHGWIVLPALIWVLLDLTQLRHTQLVVQCDWGHAPTDMSALHERAPYWPMEESVALSMPGRCWLVSSGTQNRTEPSQTLRNLCTWYSSEPNTHEDSSLKWGAGMPETSSVISLTDQNQLNKQKSLNTVGLKRSEIIQNYFMLWSGVCSFSPQHQWRPSLLHKYFFLQLPHVSVQINNNLTITVVTNTCLIL